MSGPVDRARRALTVTISQRTTRIRTGRATKMPAAGRSLRVVLPYLPCGVELLTEYPGPARGGALGRCLIRDASG